MANIANNIVLVKWRNDATLKQKQKLVDDFKENLVYDEFYTEPDLYSDFDAIELIYGSRWNEGREELEEIAERHNVVIKGVCYEWGNGYVNSFEI